MRDHAFADDLVGSVFTEGVPPPPGGMRPFDVGPRNDLRAVLFGSVGRLAKEIGEIRKPTRKPTPPAADANRLLEHGCRAPLASSCNKLLLVDHLSEHRENISGMVARVFQEIVEVRQHLEDLRKVRIVSEEQVVDRPGCR